VTERLALTILTVLTLESSSTQTAVSFVGKTGLTGCFVLARVVNTGALRKIKARNVTFQLYIIKVMGAENINLDSLYSNSRM